MIVHVFFLLFFEGGKYNFFIQISLAQFIHMYYNENILIFE